MLPGCASSSGAGTVNSGAFRSAFAGTRPRTRALEAQINTELLTDRAPTAGQLGARASALAQEAEHSLVAVSGLAAPPRDNTRLRDVRSALGLVLDDLGAITSGAADHDRAATAAAVRSLRTDAAVLTATEAALSQMLGLPTGRG